MAESAKQPDPDLYAKISRNAEAFWVGNVREVEPGVYVGTVANELADPRFPLGAKISFVDAEWTGELQDAENVVPFPRHPNRNET